MDYPKIAPFRRAYDHPRVLDPPGRVAELIRSSRIGDRVRPGGRIAVTVGSRGIAGIAPMARAAVDSLAAMGFRPFIVAAMGSHGGATSEGQRSLLDGYGVSEKTMGCDVLCDMDTVVLGESSLGLPIHFDRNAHSADGIVLMNRIKPHTSFHGRYESGLLKMLTIGLGKREGAAQVHKLGLPGLEKLLPEVGAHLLGRTKVVLGLAILENARDETAEVAALEPESLLDEEPKLLDRARALMPSLPLEKIDVLIVGELGKNYSGTGLDPNVIGRQRVETMPDLPSPQVTRLAVLDLSPESEGNSLGTGLADLVTARLAEAADPEPVRVNCFTSNFLTRARMPLALPTDRDVLVACLNTCWKLNIEDVVMLLIPNTLELTDLWMTSAAAARATVALEQTGEYEELSFSHAGGLNQEKLFPQSARGRRARARA